ncbi:MAG: phosphoadenosine phosphosulfate reductase family protein [Thermoguttaceae bacterium]|nr:phosphoadenosine phosphosulfate reductase family protein [Thermoguttaceae bacterium]
MYAYTYDPETGGILLNDSTPLFSKEPRPVYAREMDILGFDQQWKYDKQDDFPYMWAESNVYWYRGVQAAKTRGGSLYVKPEIEYLSDADGKLAVPEGETLQPVDLETMCEKNRGLLDVLEQMTVKKIFDVYKRYRKKLDCFHVAFSGGKDSIVLLELVKKALPKSSFVVVFGDTGMEFPDTYDVIDRVETQCREEKIEFYRAASHLQPEESWRLFGPPSRVLRWCCSVHKSTPQVLKLREILKKPDYQGMAFVGVRAHESLARDEQLTQKASRLWNKDEYGYVDFYGKVKGQITAKSIYEWSSVEIWLYTYAQKLLINDAYKKGCARVGCLCCPMGGNSKADFFQYVNYRKEMEPLVQIIIESNGREMMADNEYIANGGWNARKNGNFLKNNPVGHYSENITNGELLISIESPKTNWQEWIKTIGSFNIRAPNEYSIDFRNKHFPFTVSIQKDGIVVAIAERLLKENPDFGKLFRHVFRKAAYCVQCGACLANCRFNSVSFTPNLSIHNCRNCHECHNISAGCFAYDSLKIPQGNGANMKMTINCFSNHAPKTEWLSQFFELKNDFWAETGLNQPQVTKFKTFLKAAGCLIEKDVFSPFADLICKLGWESESSLSLMLSNLAYNLQIQWYIKNMTTGQEYSKAEIEGMLEMVGQSKGNISSILYAFKRLCDLPLGTVLNFGVVEKSGKEEYLTRTKTCVSDARVILYSLYKYAEACEGYYQFSLARLMDNTVESAGVSPAQIFGLDRDEMEQFLNAASVKYPEFIHVSFTHDLDKIDLREDKSSQDVLTLF